MNSVSAYARAGVDTAQAAQAVGALVGVLQTIDPGRESRNVLSSGHYASVLRLTADVGLALSTDGVGTKLIVAEQLERFDTVGIDCVAMNVNDVICVGADPIAMLDYIAVEEAGEDLLADIARGLKSGAESAGIEIPGGEVAVVPEMIQGHPSPMGFDLVGMCVGLVDPGAVITGRRIRPGDVVVGLPSNGVHANGLTLARQAFPDLGEEIADLGGRRVGDVLLDPTTMYVQAIRELIASNVEVRGLAHITSDGMLNLLRLDAAVGYRIDAPLPVPRIFELVAEHCAAERAELYEVFNMGCGFCCVVPREQASDAVALLSLRHTGAAVIGEATDRTGLVELPTEGLAGRANQGFAPVQP